MGEEQKDYIINLRVSRATYEKVKRKAKENRETVSNLLRKVIEDSSEVIHDLSDDLFGTKKSWGEVVAYSKVQVAKDAKCAQCGSAIEKGSGATMGETAGAKKYFFCENCR